MRKEPTTRTELDSDADEELDAWYGDGPTDPRVPVQGDKLMVEECGGLGEETHVKVPYLQYLPAAWAQYFIVMQTPATLACSLPTTCYLTKNVRE
jgi:hypothetical protein